MADERTFAIFANNRACALRLAGRATEALTQLAEILPTLVRLRNPWANYFVLSSLGEVYADLGDHERAARLLGTSDAIADWLGATVTQQDLTERDDIISAIRQSLSATEWGRGLSSRQVMPSRGRHPRRRTSIGGSNSAARSDGPRKRKNSTSDDCPAIGLPILAGRGGSRRPGGN